METHAVSFLFENLCRLGPAAVLRHIIQRGDYMPEVVFYVIIMLLSLVGIAALIWWLRLYFLLPENGLYMYMLVPLDLDNAEYRLRAAAEAMLFEGPRFCRGIIAVDMGVSDEEKQICRRLSDEYGNIKICDLNDLEDYILKANIISDG